MMRKIALVSALTFFSLSVSPGCAAKSLSRADWNPPAAGVVRDPEAAITIARAIWLSMHPEIASRIGNDEVWQSNMNATLQGGVWEVTSKIKTNEIGGGLFIYISQKDARVVNIYLTQ